MRDFPKCLGENGVQLGDASCSNMGMHNKFHHNPTTCIYECKLFDKITLITLAWSKNLMGQIMVTIQIDDNGGGSDDDDDVDTSKNKSHICRVDVKPFLFSRRKGSKCFDLALGKIDLFWDLSNTKFGPDLDPLEGYYIGVACEGTMGLLVGDLTKEAFKRSGAIASFSSGSLVSKRVHVFGKRVFRTKAQFWNQGSIHDVEIEHEASCSGGDEMTLVIRVDSKMVLKVRHLRWKFRGNAMLSIDGMLVEVSWDVHNWLFGPGLGSAIFVFSARLMDNSMWGSPCSYESKVMGLGFSLFLYAWKNE